MVSLVPGAASQALRNGLSSIFVNFPHLPLTVFLLTMKGLFAGALIMVIVQDEKNNREKLYI
jgi:hypothetical protein